MDDQNDQISVILKIHQHDDKMSRTANHADYYNSQVLEGTYYKMPSVILDSIFHEIKIPYLLKATELE